MASRSVHIANMAAAIEEGVLPGAFNSDRTAFVFPALEYKGARSGANRWQVSVRLLETAKDGSSCEAPITPEMLAPAALLHEGYTAEIKVEAGKVGGKIRDSTPIYVSRGKNLGRKNATNAITQALRDALGMHNKQQKRRDMAPPVPTSPTPTSTSPTPTPTSTSPTPTSTSPPSSSPPSSSTSSSSTSSPQRMPPPMIAHRGDTVAATLSTSDYKNGITIQRKLNGVHLVAFAETRPVASTTPVVLYSRTGSVYPDQPHITSEIRKILSAAPAIAPGEFGVPTDASPSVVAAYADYPTPYLDGELFLEGKPLNWISGQARGASSQGDLEFHVFDVFFPAALAAGHNMPSRSRQAYLDALFKLSGPQPHVVRVANYPVTDPAKIQELTAEFLKEGYEGAIARRDNAGYRYSLSNYHSPDVIKLKPVFDAEFPVVGFTQGSKGKDVGAIIWICRVPKPIDPRDDTFSVVPRDLKLGERRALFQCLSEQVPDADGKMVTLFDRDWKGLPLTVAYREISAKTGKPLQAKALIFRTYESGPDSDPVRRLLSKCRPQ